MFKASEEQHRKLDVLRARLNELGCVAIAFSGGVDSSFLAKVAFDELGEHVFALTNSCAFNPEREQRESAELAREVGIDQTVITLDPLQIPELASNPKDRCYHCKKTLFSHLQELANKMAWERGLVPQGAKVALVDGSNTSDLADFRPGAKAVAELGVISPLQEADLSKQDIRDLSRELGLATWNKPSFACLASRFPYGSPITIELLERVDKAEQLMIDAGFVQVRVRVHDDGELARIEVERDKCPAAFGFLFTEHGSDRLKELGFKHVSLDMSGYRTGSMN